MHIDYVLSQCRKTLTNITGWCLYHIAQDLHTKLVKPKKPTFQFIRDIDTLVILLRCSLALSILLRCSCRQLSVSAHFPNRNEGLTFAIEMKGWQSLIESFLEVKGDPQILDCVDQLVEHKARNIVVLVQEPLRWRHSFSQILKFKYSHLTLCNMNIHKHARSKALSSKFIPIVLKSINRNQLCLVTNQVISQG